jgi:hypothetical protein
VLHVQVWPAERQATCAPGLSSTITRQSCCATAEISLHNVLSILTGERSRSESPSIAHRSGAHPPSRHGPRRGTLCRKGRPPPRASWGPPVRPRPVRVGTTSVPSQSPRFAPRYDLGALVDGRPRLVEFPPPVMHPCQGIQPIRPAGPPPVRFACEAQSTIKVLPLAGPSVGYIVHIERFVRLQQVGAVAVQFLKSIRARIAVRFP